MARATSAFAAAFAVFYVLAFGYNLTPFTYFPAVNEIRWGVVPGSDTIGPPMFWYGWIVYGFIVGAIAGAIAWVMPRTTDRVWAVLAGLVPLGSIAYMAWEGRHWFTYQFPG